jgi:hypothetical protein
MQVTVLGAKEVSAKLQALPEHLRRGLFDATTRATTLEADAIRSDSPRLTGTLAGSFQTEVTRTAAGARGRIWSDLRYTPFVESGTVKHGRAQHMVERGSTQVRGQVDDLYRLAVDEVAAAIG